MAHVVPQAGFVQLWDRAALKVEGTYYQNLSSFDPVTNQPVPGSLVGETLQRAPIATLWGQQRVGDIFLADVNASSVDYQRGNGADGFRLDMQPGLTLALPLGNAFFGSLRASGRETAYHLTNTDLIGGGSVGRDDSRELVEVDGQVGTVLDRIYPVSFFGLEKLKHTIEPSVQYLYIPAVTQTDLAFLDGVDRVERRNLVTYGFTSRFIGRFQSEPDDSDTKDSNQHKDDAANGLVRELGRFSITQSADITHDIDPEEPDRPITHFSDMDIAARINPSRFFSLDSATVYDPSSASVASTRVGLFVEDPRNIHDDGQKLDTRTSARVSYRVLSQNKLQEIDDAFVLRLTDLAGLLYSSRYDLVESRFLDNFFGLRLISACDCWALEVAVSDRTNPHEVEVRTQLTLVGLGSSSRSNSRSAGQP